MNVRVLVFLALVTILTSVAFGLSPALKTSRDGAAEALKEGGRANSAGRGAVRARNVFVAAQVAAAFILLAGAGLLIRSFQRVMDVDIGYDMEGIVAAYLPLPMERNPDIPNLTGCSFSGSSTKCALFPGCATPRWQRRSLSEGGATACRSIWPTSRASRSEPDSRSYRPSTSPRWAFVSFPGRMLDDRDTASSPPVIVVNESFVQR